MEGPWDAIGLVREPGQRDRFVCTDNLSGWFEGFTHSFGLGRGYRIRDAFVVKGWRSSLAGRTLDRESKAVRDTVFPWGHRVDYPDACEELLLHSGRRILSLRVSGPTDAEVAIEVDWAERPAGIFADTVRFEGGVHLIFGESQEELEANRRAASEPGAWEAEITARWQTLTRAWFVTDDEDYNRALFWASASARGLVNQEFGVGVWGRDTFISLPGALLCSGDFTTARAVLENFARRQNDDPADGTLWFIRELEEYLRHTGDRAFARSLRPLIRRYVDDADTGMDDRVEGHEPSSPRGAFAIEIQALWIEALEVGRRLAEADGDAAEAADYGERAAQAREALKRRFIVDGRWAEHLRPNALLLAWINEDPIDDEVLRQTTSVLAEALLLPIGGWNEGFTITALNRFGWQNRSWELTRNLTRQILDLGCVGAVSEFVRNAYQDYLGWRPDLPRAELRFRPSLPSSWEEVQARLPYGTDAVTVHVVQQKLETGGLRQTWTWEGSHAMPLLVLELPTADGTRERREIEPTGIKTRFEVDLPPPQTDVLFRRLTGSQNPSFADKV